MATLGMFLTTVGVLAFFVGIVALVIAAIMKKKKKPWTITIAAGVAAAVLGTVAGVSSLSDSDKDSTAESTSSKKMTKAESKESSKKEAAHKKAVAESKKKAAEKASAKSESKVKVASSKKAASSSKKTLAENRKKGLKKQKESNYAAFLLTVANVPHATKGAITDASYDQNSQTLTFVLSDVALGMTPAQLKVTVHNAWQSGVNLIDNARPMPDDKVGAASMVDVKDSAGDVLGTTGLLGGFKYKAQ